MLPHRGNLVLGTLSAFDSQHSLMYFRYSSICCCQRINGTGHSNGKYILGKSPRDADHLQQGDILAFERNDGELVLHRILRRTEAGIVTKGDANSVPDAALVRVHQIKGKVLFSVPYVGKAFMKNAEEFAVFFLTGSVILFILLKTVKISGGTYYEKHNTEE